MFVCIRIIHFVHQSFFALEVRLHICQQFVEHPAHVIIAGCIKRFGTDLCREIKKIPVVVVDLFVADG